jgi:hypothetical protein
MKDADAAVNFGAVVAVVGHELTHGFDDQGRRFDPAGNMRDWWTPADGKSFEDRALCIDKQYSNYTAIDDVKLNGKLTLGENTADNGGMRLAWMALMELMKTAAREDGRTDAGTAVLHRLGTDVVREPHAGDRAPARQDQPAFARPLPDGRRRLQHAGVLESVQLFADREDGAAARLPRVVSRQGRSMTPAIGALPAAGLARRYFDVPSTCFRFASNWT